MNQAEFVIHGANLNLISQTHCRFFLAIMGDLYLIRTNNMEHYIDVGVLIYNNLAITQCMWTDRHQHQGIQ